MNPEQVSAITNFFDAADRLEESGVIRSSRFLGDIGEFLCKEVFQITLVEQLCQTGHDCMDGRERVQIKFSNSTMSNNINVGNPAEYDALVVVVGPRSKLREQNHGAEEFKLYRYTKAEVMSWETVGKNYFCAKERLVTCKVKCSLSTQS